MYTDVRTAVGSDANWVSDTNVGTVPGGASDPGQAYCSSGGGGGSCGGDSCCTCLNSCTYFNDNSCTFAQFESESTTGNCADSNVEAGCDSCFQSGGGCDQRRRALISNSSASKLVWAHRIGWVKRKTSTMEDGSDSKVSLLDGSDFSVDRRSTPAAWSWNYWSTCMKQTAHVENGAQCDDTNINTGITACQDVYTKYMLVYDDSQCWPKEKGVPIFANKGEFKFNWLWFVAHDI